MTRLCIAVLAALVGLAAPAAARTLEELIEGRFVASGFNRVTPGQAAHRMLCRLTGKRLDARRLSLAGRCAAAEQTAEVAMVFTIEEPGRRYAMHIGMKMSATQGYERAYDYRGVATDSALVFESPFMLAGRQYQSTFTVSLRDEAVMRIVETVEAIETGVKSVLIDLRMTRDQPR
ncbi:MAG: hypothetical protein AB7O88_25680 [Reyranellaceae bacterium]